MNRNDMLRDIARMINAGNNKAFAEVVETPQGDVKRIRVDWPIGINQTVAINIGEVK